MREERICDDTMLKVSILFEMEDNAGARYDLDEDSFEVTVKNFDKKIKEYLVPFDNYSYNGDPYGIYAKVAHITIEIPSGREFYKTVRIFNSWMEISNGAFCGWEAIESFTFRHIINKEKIDEEMEKNKNALNTLREVHEKFGKVLSQDKWDEEEIKRLILENPHLPVARNYDMRNKFDKDGLHTGLGERFFVFDINISVSSTLYDGYFVQQGNYDLEDNIRELEEVI